jgi:hypothetical protein
MMHFVHSMPWPYKICLLLLFLYQPLKMQSVRLDAPTCLRAVALYMLATALPSMVYSVKNRMQTTAYIQMSTLVMLTSHVLLEWLRHGNDAHGCLNLAVAFTCVHALVSQRAIMRGSPAVILLSGVFQHTHVLCVACLLISANLLNNDMGAMNLHKSVCILATVFAGEVSSCVAYVVYMLFKTAGDMWQSVWF